MVSPLAAEAAIALASTDKVHAAVGRMWSGVSGWLWKRKGEEDQSSEPPAELVSLLAAFSTKESVTAELAALEGRLTSQIQAKFEASATKMTRIIACAAVGQVLVLGSAFLLLR